MDPTLHNELCDRSKNDYVTLWREITGTWTPECLARADLIGWNPRGIPRRSNKMWSGIFHHKSDRKPCVLPTADRNMWLTIFFTFCWMFTASFHHLAGTNNLNGNTYWQGCQKVSIFVYKPREIYISRYMYISRQDIEDMMSVQLKSVGTIFIYGFIFMKHAYGPIYIYIYIHIARYTQPRKHGFMELQDHIFILKKNHVSMYIVLRPKWRVSRLFSSMWK